MTVHVTLVEGGKTVKIAPNGRFDFSLHREFRDAYSGQPREMNYIVELRHVGYMDSSALGMMLLLREHAGGDKAKIKITNPSPEVREILGIANFNQLFVIE